MTFKPPNDCPVCASKLVIRELACDHCETTINGRFDTTRLGSLNDEQLTFVEVFIRARGNIKEVERELGISYPTVRNKLEQIISAFDRIKIREIDSKHSHTTNSNNSIETKNNNSKQTQSSLRDRSETNNLKRSDVLNGDEALKRRDTIKKKKQDVLQSLDEGLIDVEEALEQLKRLS